LELGLEIKKGGKPDLKPYLYGFRKPYKTINH
jgi:hypothetical protein